MDTNKRDPRSAEANTTREGFLNTHTPRIGSIIIKRTEDQGNDDSAAAAVHRDGAEARAAVNFH